MQISGYQSGVTGLVSQLSTRPISFSTRYRHQLHVRDVDFVRVFHKCTYGGTGADSRVGLASAPAFPNQVVVSNIAVVAASLLASPAAHSRPSLSCSSASITV